MNKSEPRSTLRMAMGMNMRDKRLKTDFPLNEITLYASWDGEHWVLMLPSEY